MIFNKLNFVLQLHYQSYLLMFGVAMAGLAFRQNWIVVGKIMLTVI